MQVKEYLLNEFVPLVANDEDEHAPLASLHEKDELCDVGAEWKENLVGPPDSSVIVMDTQLNKALSKAHEEEPHSLDTNGHNEVKLHAVDNEERYNTVAWLRVVLEGCDLPGHMCAFLE